MQKIDVKNLSSLSGMCKMGEVFFVVSDEYHSLLVTDLKKNFVCEFDKIKNNELRSMAYKDRKQIKPDFESLSLLSIGGRTYLHILPSFSTFHRRYGALLEISNREDVFSEEAWGESLDLDLTALYTYLNEMVKDLNIEGHFFKDKNMYLLSRGNLNIPNKLICVSGYKNALENFLQNPSKTSVLINIRDIQISEVFLGEYQGNQLQWTESCSKNENEFYFLATVEKVVNATDDGEVVASFLGEFDLVSMKVSWVQKLIDGEKLEGLSYNDNGFVVCADPDGHGEHGKILYGIKL